MRLAGPWLLGRAASAVVPPAIPSPSYPTPTPTPPALPAGRLAVNNFSGRSGYACPVGAPQPCQLDGADILSQLGFEGDSVGQAFMGLLLLMVRGVGGGVGGWGELLQRPRGYKFCCACCDSMGAGLHGPSAALSMARGVRG